MEIVEERYEAIITAATQMEVWLSATCNEYSNPCADIYNQTHCCSFCSCKFIQQICAAATAVNTTHSSLPWSGEAAIGSPTVIWPANNNEQRQTDERKDERMVGNRNGRYPTPKSDG